MCRVAVGVVYHTNQLRLPPKAAPNFLRLSARNHLGAAVIGQIFVADFSDLSMRRGQSAKQGGARRGDFSSRG